MTTFIKESWYKEVKKFFEGFIFKSYLVILESNYPKETMTMHYRAFNSREVYNHACSFCDDLNKKGDVIWLIKDMKRL